MIQISNCPISGLTRKVEYNFLWYKLQRQIIIECFVSFFDAQGNKIENERIKTYKRNLVASDSLVDFNGVLLPEGTAYDPQSNIYEYDYYAQLGSNQIVLNTQLANIIALRDSQGKFDI